MPMYIFSVCRCFFGRSTYSRRFSVSIKHIKNKCVNTLRWKYPTLLRFPVEKSCLNSLQADRNARDCEAWVNKRGPYFLILLAGHTAAVSVLLPKGIQKLELHPTAKGRSLLASQTFLTIFWQSNCHILHERPPYRVWSFPTLSNRTIQQILPVLRWKRTAGNTVSGSTTPVQSYLRQKSAR